MAAGWLQWMSWKGQHQHVLLEFLETLASALPAPRRASLELRLGHQISDLHDRCLDAARTNVERVRQDTADSCG
jgi:hypothetical protein